MTRNRAGAGNSIHTPEQVEGWRRVTEIPGIVQQCADAAGRARDAIENRARFLLEVTRAVIDRLGADAVGVRLSPRGTFSSMSDSTRAATCGYAVRRLNELGLAYLDLVDPIGGGGGCTSDERLAPGLRELFSGPIIINGGCKRESALTVLERGEADLVAVGVPFLANPDLPARLRRSTRLTRPFARRSKALMVAVTPTTRRRESSALFDYIARRSGESVTLALRRAAAEAIYV